jgi:hypothetical protein
MNTGPTSALGRLSKHQYTLILALLVGPGIFAGCAQNYPNNNTNQPTNIAQGVQTATPTPSPPGLGDRPVIITGGSLEIDFDRERDYNVREGDNAFRSRGARLSALQLYDDERGNSATLPAIVIAGLATIQIVGRRDGMAGTRVMFTIKGDAGGVLITFDQADFTPRGTQRHGRSRKHFDQRFHLEDVILQDGNHPTPTSVLTRERCVNKNKCTVEIGA